MASYKHIIRIANTDLDGSKPVGHALQKIKGVSFMMANAVCTVTGVDKKIQAGKLDPGSVDKLTEAIIKPLSHEIPIWMVNRRNDPEEGVDKHLIATNIRFVQDNDKKKMAMTKSYKGIRHQVGLPVRGQRTKSNFRRNKGKVQGVKRKASNKTGK